jgi:DNA-directed RNA polymerase subunit alpha
MLRTEMAETPTFVKPERLEADEATLSDTYGKFTLQPLERGFGTTLGTGLRRTLLSSMEGAAIVAIRIEKVQHEFSTVPGVVEDVTELVLNLKEVSLRLHSEEPKTILIQKDGPGKLTAGDLGVDSAVEIVNADHTIATLDEGASISMELDVASGRGFVFADDVTNEDTPIGTVPIDAVHSPVKKVNFEVGNARVGQQTDYDQLDLEVWTDGSTTPRAAVAQAARLVRSHLQLFLDEGEAEAEALSAAPVEETVCILDLKVEEMELSMRSINCLRAAGIATVEELVAKPENDMLKYRNFGRKSLIELTDILTDMGLGFGMDPDVVAEIRVAGVAPAADAVATDEEETQ